MNHFLWNDEAFAKEIDKDVWCIINRAGGICF